MVCLSSDGSLCLVSWPEYTPREDIQITQGVFGGMLNDIRKLLDNKNKEETKENAGRKIVAVMLLNAVDRCVEPLEVVIHAWESEED